MTTQIKNISINQNDLVISYEDNKPIKNKFNLAPNSIFMDTYGYWAFLGPGFPALSYNCRAIVNYLYQAKTFSENSSSIKDKQYPINLFQLSGGNIPLTNDSNTNPSTYIPANDVKTLYNNQNYTNADDSKHTSPFATFLFGKSTDTNLNSDFSNVPTDITSQSTSSSNWGVGSASTKTTLKDYFSIYNKETNIKASDFGIDNIDIFDWNIDKTSLLKSCNIKSINWGSNSSYTIAPYALNTQNISGSWILNQQVKKYRINNPISNTSHNTYMGGFIDSNFTAYNLESQSKYTNYIDHLATYTSSLEGGTSIKKEFNLPDEKIDRLICSLPTKNTKPYFVNYNISGSGSTTIFWNSIRYIKYSIGYIVNACLSMEDNGFKQKYNNDEIWGYICISPDFGLFAQELAKNNQTWWKALQGDWTSSENNNSIKTYDVPDLDAEEALNSYKNNNDIHLKKMTTEIINAFISDDNKNKFPVNWITYLTKLYSYVNSSDSDEIFGDNGIIDISKNGIRSINAVIAFFLNTCGPHIEAGWDIGWVFNNIGNGGWVHKSFTPQDFEYHSDAINSNGFIDKSKTGPSDVALYYLKNSIYGNLNEKYISNPPEIFVASEEPDKPIVSNCYKNIAGKTCTCSTKPTNCTASTTAFCNQSSDNCKSCSGVWCE